MSIGGVLRSFGPKNMGILVCVQAVAMCPNIASALTISCARSDTGESQATLSLDLGSGEAVESFVSGRTYTRQYRIVVNSSQLIRLRRDEVAAGGDRKTWYWDINRLSGSSRRYVVWANNPSGEGGIVLNCERADPRF